MKEFLAKVSRLKSKPVAAYGQREVICLKDQTVNGFLLETFKTPTKVLKRYILDSSDSIYEIRSTNRQEVEFYQNVRGATDDPHLIVPILLGTNAVKGTYYLPDYGQTLQDLSTTFTGANKDALVLTLLATQATAPCKHPDGVLKNICLYKNHIAFNYTWYLTIDQYLVKVRWQHNGVVMPIDWTPTARAFLPTKPCSSSTIVNQTQEVTFTQSLSDLCEVRHGRPYNFVGTVGFINLMVEALRRGESVITECKLYSKSSRTKRCYSVLEIEPATVSVDTTNNSVSKTVTSLCAKLFKMMRQPDFDFTTLQDRLKKIYAKVLQYRTPDDCVPCDTGKVCYQQGRLYAAQNISPNERITKLPTTNLANVGGSRRVVCVSSTMKVPLRLMLPFCGFGGFARVVTKKEEANCQWRYQDSTLWLCATKSIPSGGEILLNGEEREATGQELECETLNQVQDKLNGLLREQGVQTRSQAQKEAEEVVKQFSED